MGTRTRTERKEDFGGGFGFGVVENSHMVLPHHHHHHQHPSSSSSSLCYCVGDPIYSASTTSSLGEMFSLSGSASGSDSVSVSVSDPFFSLSSSEKGSGAFSEAQWLELERQRNIYKYMMASLPVPSELLTTPFSKNPNPNVTVANGGSLKLGIAFNASNNNTDQEPWRCKRTDGKKWRCSRNVIPDQKYCERHTHKSRPRSRKHVEPSQSTNNIITHKKNDTTSCHFTNTYPQFYEQPGTQFSLLPTFPSSYDHHRGVRWFMREDDGLNPEIHEKVGSSKRGFGYDLNFRQKEPLVDQRFGALEGLLSVEGEQDEAMGSSLTLSMAGGGGMEEGTNQQQQWVNHEGPSWLCSTTPGGPLAEALCLGVSSNPSTSTTTSSCSRSSS